MRCLQGPLCVAALHAAAAAPRPAGGAGNPSGVSGTAALQTRGVALRQEPPVTEHAQTAAAAAFRVSGIKSFFCACRLDFEYLSELPVLVLDVNEDFQNDRIKQEDIVDKVLLY